MEIIKVGYSTFNADVLKGKSLDELKEQYPNMREELFKELAGKLGITKSKAKKKPQTESTED